MYERECMVGIWIYSINNSMPLGCLSQEPAIWSGSLCYIYIRFRTGYL